MAAYFYRSDMKVDRIWRWWWCRRIYFLRNCRIFKISRFYIGKGLGARVLDVKVFVLKIGSPWSTTSRRLFFGTNVVAFCGFSWLRHLWNSRVAPGATEAKQDLRGELMSWWQLRWPGVVGPPKMMMLDDSMILFFKSCFMFYGFMFLKWAEPFWKKWSWPINRCLLTR